MSYFSELWFLIKILFKSNPTNDTKLRLLKMNHFPFAGYKYMSYCGYCIYTNDRYANINQVDYNHESIHLKLAVDEGSWIKFYWKYFIEYMKANPLTNTSACYATSKYEVEAYAKEDDLNYLNYREINAADKFIINDRKTWYKENSCFWRQEMKDMFKDA